MTCFHLQILRLLLQVEHSKTIFSSSDVSINQLIADGTTNSRLARASTASSSVNPSLYKMPQLLGWEERFLSSYFFPSRLRISFVPCNVDHHLDRMTNLQLFHDYLRLVVEHANTVGGIPKSFASCRAVCHLSVSSPSLPPIRTQVCYGLRSLQPVPSPIWIIAVNFQCACKVQCPTVHTCTNLEIALLEL